MCFRPATVQADKRCPVCSNSNPLSATHCGACGTELPEIAEAGVAMPPEKMPGAFGDSGIAGGGFQPRIPQVPTGAPTAPIKPPSPPNPTEVKD